MPPKTAAYYKKQKEKEKRKKQAEMEKIKEEHEKHDGNQLNNRMELKKMELEVIQKHLMERNLVMVDMKADGNCLFSSLCHQMADDSAKMEGIVLRIRKTIADHIMAHPETYAPFISAEDIPGGMETMSAGELLELYCNNLASNMAHLGSHLEIQAASEVYNVSIDIISGTGVEVVGSNSGVPHYTIVFLQYLYTLGAHYNSTRLAKGKFDAGEREEE